MKKIFFALLVFLAFATTDTLQAQGFIRGGAGAGFGMTKDGFAIPALTRDSNNVVVSQRTIFGSFGQGARFSLAGGYMITPYFGVELEIYYFQGFKQEYGSNTGPTGTQYNRTGYSYQMRATPSLIVQAPEGKFQPYARFGLLLPFWGKTVLEESWTFSDQSTRAKQTDVEGKLSFGFEASMGLQYNINENIGIYLQATYTGLRIKSDKATVVKDMEVDKDGNENNRLDGAQTLLTQIEFQDEMTKESNTSSLLGAFVGDLPDDVLIQIDGNKLDFDKPLNLPTQTSNFGAFSFSVGVKYTFSKKEK